MRKVALPLIAFAVALTFSCTKSENNRAPNATLIGTWYLNAVQTQIRSTVETRANGIDYRDDTLFSYTSGSNTGAINITGDSIYSIGLSYLVSDTFYIREYQDSIQTNPFPDGWQISYSNSYPDLGISMKMVGSDSIFFPNGALLKESEGFGIPSPIIFYGAKYVIKGNELTFKAIAKVDTVYTYAVGLLPGIPMYHQYVTVTATFHR